MTGTETTSTPGVYQLDNGFWGYRYTLTVNGKKKDFKKTKDELGKPFKTAKAAFRARETAIVREKENRTQRPQMQRMTFAEVYQVYCEQGRNEKAYLSLTFYKYYITKIFLAQFAAVSA